MTENGHGSESVPSITVDGELRAALLPLIDEAEERFRTAEDRALLVLRRAIELRLFAPGQRLPQDTLAALLGFSRMPIRAALRQLESEGFVDHEPHRGAVVRLVPTSEIQDLYEIRILVEAFALRRVAVRADEQDIRRLDELAERIDSATTDRERAALMDEFYRGLYRTGNTARVVALVMQLRSEVNRHVASTPYGKETHRELLDALSMEDPDLAAAWLTAHLRKLAKRAVGAAADHSDESDGGE